MTTKTPKPETQRGGKRANAGKKPLNPGEPMTHHTISIDALTVTKLKVLGGGNVSEGVRRAADVAYDRYSRS